MKDEIDWLHFISLQYSRWISSHRGMRRNICGYHRAGSDNGVFADGHAAEYGRATANAGPALDDDGHDRPVIIRLYGAARPGGARIFVVDEGHAMTHEDLVFNRHAFTDKSMARDFAVTTHAGTFLNLDEGTDFSAVADLATVEVNEMVNDYVTTESNVSSDYAELSRHE